MQAASTTSTSGNQVVIGGGVGERSNDTGSGSDQIRSGSSWGSFPQDFVDFQFLTGQASYWYSSGGTRDAAKPTTPLYISYDATNAVAPVPPAPDGEAGGGGTAVTNTAQRPAAGPAAPAAPSAAPGLSFPLANSSVLLPEGPGLIPGALGEALNPVLLPLLGTMVALSLSILAVLYLMAHSPGSVG